MRIAINSPIIERIPAKKYGGTERVIYALTEELVKMGHQVTLFASGDSITSAKLVAVFPRALREPGSAVEDIYGPNGWSMINIGLPYIMQDEFDIIHEHHNIIAAPTANLSKTPVVMTIHGALDVDPSHKALYETMNNINYVSISHSQARPAPKMNWAGMVYNGTLYGNYSYQSQPGNYLLFVGRISQQKGVHHAIEVAQKLDLPLIIAAKLENADGNIQYFKEKIEPHLNQKIQWIGEVDEQQRNELMKKALCFLHPVTWSEPFGLTLAESMACGCPVVAFGLGSIPEIVVNGKTGFVVNTTEEMVEAIKKINLISRQSCHQYAMENFNPRKMAEEYVKIYRQVLAQKDQKKLSTNFAQTAKSPLVQLNY
jgi:glycosyltransferase involved in cell wall biosynthesis